MIHFNSTDEINQAVIELHNIARIAENHLGSSHNVCKLIRQSAELLVEELHSQYNTEKGN